MTEPPLFALDTSVAVPLLISAHEAHRAVRSWSADRALHLSGHALTETYSVLTRLPGDARLAPSDAVTLIDDTTSGVLTLPDEAAVGAHHELSRCGVAGGAAYDGLVALAAREHGAVLVTRDARARVTYEAVGARVEVLA